MHTCIHAYITLPEPESYPNPPTLTFNRRVHVTDFNQDRSLDRDRSIGEVVDRDRFKGALRCPAAIN